MKVAEINFLDIEENKEYIDILNKVLEKCFEEEKLNSKKLYINIVLTNPQNIREINKQYILFFFSHFFFVIFFHMIISH